MPFEEKEINPSLLSQFNKICLLNNIANQIACFGVQCGNEQLLDYIDMNCGGIPDGEFEQVVDVDSPMQFLQMYTQIAEKRFAFAVTELLKMNEVYLNSIEEFCNRTGREMNVPALADMEDAFNVVNSFYLDGMFCDNSKKVIQNDENLFVWEKQKDFHEDAWKKAGGQIEIYYRLLQSFVNGLLFSSGIELEIENMSKFRLFKA